ncbi:hypothetical protein K431DRAFT_280278 [Polychaeton citri CBS 116435]|uniref:Uncharacterized protein n=1 Tax=Polychaeton citri CBS 116435 TaxID=1314669 RepID=A0A9P4QJX9_9PEZI|nr:hypothetical protein K431DRAFT_280278 [Polychaeton citri CBS 116435]
MSHLNATGTSRDMMRKLLPYLQARSQAELCKSPCHFALIQVDQVSIQSPSNQAAGPDSVLDDLERWTH